MKPVLEHLPKNDGESFVAKFFDYNYYPTPWHFHPEYEIVLVTESTGTRFIGDNISNFRQGNLAFIGPNLPHLYRNDSNYYEAKSLLRAKSIVVHFSKNTFAALLSSMPETKQLNELFRKSVFGLDIKGETNRAVSICLHELIMLDGLPKLIKLLEILNLLAGSEETYFITQAAVVGINKNESDRMNMVMEFLIKNFTNDISRAQLAKVANLSENAFSRYFTQRTRKSFMSYLIELRLNYACKLLVEGEKSIYTICFESGFNNISNFNRQFKLMYGKSPLNYSKMYLHPVD